MKYPMSNKMDRVKNPIETTVEILHIFDEDSSPEDYLFQDEDYREQDQKRLDDWKADKWHFIGIRVAVNIHNWSTGNSKRYTSAGLWGIESDNEDDYFRETAANELYQLQSENPELQSIKLEDAKVIYK